MRRDVLSESTDALDGCRAELSVVVDLVASVDVLLEGQRNDESVCASSERERRENDRLTAIPSIRRAVMNR